MPESTAGYAEGAPEAPGGEGRRRGGLRHSPNLANESPPASPKLSEGVQRVGR